MNRRAILGTDPLYGRRWLVAGVALGAACSALLGATLPNPGPWYIGVAVQALLVAVSVALLALRFGAGAVLAVDFALLFPAYYVRARATGVGFRTPVEHALPQAVADAAVLGIVGFGAWVVARRVVGHGDTGRPVERPRSE
ncbi:hypothetical protein [Halosimplex halophilum]|uniref:hypothetical protein n=1 Tax=Halosimplex halophilum TaxID=2559572 RepID=UPI00107F44E3|nr:hypothetical protein [Halosimplex halophilum]